MNKQEKKKRKKIRKARRDSSKYKLRIFWRKRRKSFSARNLLSLAREIDFPEIQKSALREFLSRGNLTFADFYRALALPKEILSLDSKLKDKLWEKCLDISTPDNLLELINLGEVKAAIGLMQIYGLIYHDEKKVSLVYGLGNITFSKKSRELDGLEIQNLQTYLDSISNSYDVNRMETFSNTKEIFRWSKKNKKFILESKNTRNLKANLR